MNFWAELIFVMSICSSLFPSSTYCLISRGGKGGSRISEYCSTSVLTRPWCLLELLEASRRGVPVVPMLIEAQEAWDPVAMRRFAANLEGELAELNPDALEMLHEHCGADLSGLQSVITAVIDAADATTAVRWNPGAGDNEIIAQLKELCERMAERLGRNVAWSDAKSSSTAP